MSDMIVCPTCEGRGQIPLTGVYLETLKILRRLTRKGSKVVSNKHATKFGCRATALNNRLARLEELGLAQSERYGRERRFWAT